MNLSYLRPVGSALYWTATTLNPLRLYQASARTRLAVAGSLLGLGAAGGVATVMTPQPQQTADPATFADVDFPAGPQPVRPIPVAPEEDTPRLAPPPGMFSQDLVSSRRNGSKNGNSPANLTPPPVDSPNQFGNDQSNPNVPDGNRFAQRLVPNSLRDPEIRPVTEAIPVEPQGEPAMLAPPSGAAASLRDDGGPSPYNNPVGSRDIALTNNAAPNDPPAVEPTQPQPLLPPKPLLGGISDNNPPRPSPAPLGNPPPPLPSVPVNGAANGFGQNSRPLSGGSRLGFPSQESPAPPAALTPGPAPLDAGSLPASPTFGSSRTASPSFANLGGSPAPDASNLVSPSPGPKQLEGMQTPSIAMEKAVPTDVQVGKRATFQTKVRNVGQVAAHQVVVMDHIPAGSRLENASPQFTQTPDGALLWKLGTLQPGEETTITMQIIPEQEGEIGSVAQVMFQAQASVRAVCTKPQITIKHAAPQKILIGESVPLTITLTNNGSGPATGLVLTDNIPEVLSHPAGTELEYEVGTLRPGETKQLTLNLRAAKAGVAKNVITATNDANVNVRDELDVEIIAPQLQVGLAGPKVRFLERQATYNVLVANPGTAPANNVELITFLPRGLKFISSDKNGQYNSQNHAVYWNLERLPPGITGEAQLVVLPIEIGEQKLRVEGRAELGLQQVFEQSVQVEGLSELQFEVADVADPVEVGGNTVYEVKITNRGHKPASNVQLIVAFPPEVQPVSGEGTSRVTVNGDQASIDPINRLAAGSQAIFKFHAKGARPGQARVRVQLLCDEAPTPVTKEESTRVYADM